MVSEIKQGQPPLIIELIADLEEGGFTARLPDIPAYGEGETEEEALADLQEALKGYIQTFGLEDAMNRLVSPQIRPVNWDLKGLARG
jgi:predicted RNase H-like HicB family nuclease